MEPSDHVITYGTKFLKILVKISLHAKNHCFSSSDFLGREGANMPPLIPNPVKNVQISRVK